MSTLIQSLSTGNVQISKAKDVPSSNYTKQCQINITKPLLYHNTSHYYIPVHSSIQRMKNGIVFSLDSF